MSRVKEIQSEIKTQGFYFPNEKYVCFDCIDNDAIKDFIRKNAEKIYCDKISFFFSLAFLNAEVLF